MSPDDAAALVAEEHGLGLAVVTPLGGGAVGAHEVMWSGGGRGVMKQLVGHGTRAGGAAFDPVTLAFCSAVAVAERAAVDRLWSHVLTARTPRRRAPVRRVSLAEAGRLVHPPRRRTGRHLDDHGREPSRPLLNSSGATLAAKAFTAVVRRRSATPTASGRHRSMETPFDDDADRPEIDQAEEIGEPGFGEHDEAAQDAEYAEDEREGGS